MRLQNSLQMVPRFRDWTKTFQGLLLSTYQYDHPKKWDNHRAYFFFIPEEEEEEEEEDHTIIIIIVVVTKQ